MSIGRLRWLELGVACGVSIALGCANEGPDAGASGEGGSGSGGSSDSGGGPSSQPPGDGQLDPSTYDAWAGVVSGAIPFGDDPCLTGACRDGAFCVQTSGASCRCSERARETCVELSFQTLPLTPDTQTGAASTVSADGTTVIGSVWSMRETSPRVAHTVLWTSSAGAAPQPGPEEARRGPDFGGDDVDAPCFLQSSGTPPEYSLRRVGAPFDVVLVAPAGGELFPSAHSRDCRVVVGSFQTLDAPSRAFRWSVERGMELFEPAPLGDSARGVSDDGNTIVGARSFDDGRSVAVRWNAAGSPEELPSPAWLSQVYASAVSADGAVILGYSLTPVQSLRWTSAGVETLGNGGVALTVLSADGRLAFGKGGEDVWVWGAESGLWRLGPLLAEAGVIGPEWDLFEVAGVSADGQVIVGSVTATRETDVMNRPTRLLPFRAQLRGVQ